jgi:hypothetical protein
MRNKSLLQIGVDEKFCLMEKAEPFKECIEIFKFLNDEKSPLDKMKMMVLMSQKIVSEIENYYINSNDKSNNVIDADQLLMILIYILIRSKIKMVSLYAHVN